MEGYTQRGIKVVYNRCWSLIFEIKILDVRLIGRHTTLIRVDTWKATQGRGINSCN